MQWRICYKPSTSKQRYVDAVGACEAAAPRHNVTGGPYFIDGNRAAILLSKTRSAPRFVAWF